MSLKYKDYPLLLDNAFLPFATDLINNATKYIYISTFKAEITDKTRSIPLKTFFNLLLLKHDEGLDVRLLINANQGIKGAPFSNFNIIHQYKKAGLKMRCFSAGHICHAKLIVVDDETAIVGSHNLSIRSCCSNFELSYVVHNIFDTAIIKTIFDEKWERARPL